VLALTHYPAEYSAGVLRDAAAVAYAGSIEVIDDGMELAITR
jgi:ribonuclease BN (tRNA processing enzyme)